MTGSSYKEGQGARLAGLALTDSPYEIGTHAYKMWREGWSDINAMRSAVGLD